MYFCVINLYFIRSAVRLQYFSKSQIVYKTPNFPFLCPRKWNNSSLANEPFTTLIIYEDRFYGSAAWFKRYVNNEARYRWCGKRVAIIYPRLSCVSEGMGPFVKVNFRVSVAHTYSYFEISLVILSLLVATKFNVNVLRKIKLSSSKPNLNIALQEIYVCYCSWM